MISDLLVKKRIGNVFNPPLSFISTSYGMISRFPGKIKVAAGILLAIFCMEVRGGIIRSDLSNTDDTFEIISLVGNPANALEAIWDQPGQPSPDYVTATDDVFEVQPQTGCPTGNIWLSSQTLIDNFIINYPQCENLPGSLSIEGETINNLNGLRNLTSIGTSLHIVNNPSLTSLTGLEGLTSVDGLFWLRNNESLTSLTGLESLTSVGESFWIDNNALLTSLAGLEGLTSVEGLSVSNNPALTSLMGLETLAFLSGVLSIGGNPLLTSLASLENLTSVGQLSLGSDLTSLAGLGNLTSIGAHLSVHNTSLTSLTGLESLTSIGGSIEIVLNASLVSLTGLENLTSIEGHIIIYSNPLTSLTGLESLTSIGTNLILESNPSLTSLTGLENLESIGGMLHINNNTSLATLDGLGGNIAGGSSSARVSAPLSVTDLTITNNPQLESCAVKLVADHLLTSGPATIASNGPDGNCNTAEDILSDWNNALPVNLITFTGRYAEGTTELTWATVEEISFNRFEIEKSIDGTSFSPAGNVPAKGTNSWYSYSVMQPEAAAYYRLKMVDFDGSYAYSNLVSVRHSGISAGVRVFPNPVVDRLFVDGGAGEQILEVTLTDLSGRLLSRSAYDPAKGVKMKDWAAGLYLVGVSTSAGFQKVYRIIKSDR